MNNLDRWTNLLNQMKRCKTLKDLIALRGEPPHRVLEQDFQIWHYPLGVDSGMLYAIHVAVKPDQSFQAYFHMQPSKAAGTSNRPGGREHEH